MFKWIGIIVLTAVLAVAGMQLVPVYLQNYAVKKIALEVVSDSEISSGGKRDLVKAVAERFDLNNINLEVKEIVTVNRDTDGEWVLGVKYEQRRKLLYNMHIVAAFDDEISN